MQGHANRDRLRPLRLHRTRVPPWRFVALAALGIAGVGVAQTPASVAYSGSESRARSVAESNESEPDPLAQCAACHGVDGNSTDPKYPKLAGQDPSYLYWQLWAFRTGSRQSEIMAPIAANLSRSDAATAASFYAQQVNQPDVVKDKALAALGERVFLGGGGSGMGPACAMCHGGSGQRDMRMRGRMGMMGGMGMMGMGGMMSNAPRLNGQRAAYVVDQLDRFADGRRQAMVMNRIAYGLTDAEKRAVAEFVSGLP